jgi:hypothetical protein
MVATGIQLRYVWLVPHATNQETSVSHLVLISASELHTHLRFLKLLSNFANGTSKHMTTELESVTEMSCVLSLTVNSVPLNKGILYQSLGRAIREMQEQLVVLL